MSAVRQKAAKVAATDVAVLLEGEAGTGKELLARWIHQHSLAGNGPFVKVNCAAIPETLLESELFGFEKGAFTGALQSKPGRVELADQGTLFLDEIAGMRPNLQAKLLQFLQDGCCTRIGDDREQRIQTRVICSTSQNLEEEIKKSAFRADLFYRINVIRIRLPKLKERIEDVELLADYFLSHFNSQFQRSAPYFSSEVLDNLKAWHWPGNVRELENRVARFVIMGPDGLQEKPNGASRFASAPPAPVAEPWVPLKRVAKLAVRELERTIILKALQANHWNRRKAAEALQISYRALIYKIREAGLSSRRSGGPQSPLDSAPMDEGQS